MAPFRHAEAGRDKPSAARANRRAEVHTNAKDAARSAEPPLRRFKIVLPLLSFGAGAADAFAFMVLGGIFTANMTGNALLGAMVTRADYWATLAGAATALISFVIALAVGFRITRGPAVVPGGSTVKALRLSAVFLAVVALLWWFAPHARATHLCMIATSAMAMAFQTVAMKRDGVPHGAPTTFATGTLTDLVKEIVEGAASWRSRRWLPLAALPLGAAVAAMTAQAWPDITPLLPFAATVVALILIESPSAPHVKPTPGR